MPERPKRIQLKGCGTYDEGRALAAITPGMLVKLTTDSAGSEGYVPHPTAGGKAGAFFALEDALQGNTIDDAYAEGDLVFIGKQVPGERIYGWLNSGEVTEVGDNLTSNGDGTLKVATGSDHVIAVALEVVDSTDSGAVNSRIRIEIV